MLLKVILATAIFLSLGALLKNFAKVQMSSLVLFLLLIAACDPKPTEDQLVQECQARGGNPDIRAQFKCEMPQAQNKQQTPPAARYN